MLVMIRLSIRSRTAMHSPAILSIMPCIRCGSIASVIVFIVYASIFVSSGFVRMSHSMAPSRFLECAQRGRGARSVPSCIYSRQMTDAQFEKALTTLRELPFREDVEAALQDLYKNAAPAQRVSLRHACKQDNLCGSKPWRNP